MVTKSKEEGGLGVLDFKTQNEAMLLKNFHKFYNRADIPGCILSGRNIIVMVGSLIMSRNGHSGGKIS